MEAFELTFFIRRDPNSGDLISGITGMTDPFAESQINTEVRVFDEEENDYLTIEFSFYDFHITKESLHPVVRKLTQFAGSVFRLSDAVAFATGVYELTYYFTEHIHRLSDFSEESFSRFPLYFLRQSEVNRGKASDMMYESDHTVCFYNQNAQHIIPSCEIS